METRWGQSGIELTSLTARPGDAALLATSPLPVFDLISLLLSVISNLNGSRAMRKLFIPVTVGAGLSLAATLSSWSHETHLMVRVFVFLAACFPLVAFWRHIESHQKVALSITALLYNPILLIQLGSGLSWIIAGVVILTYFGKQVLGSNNLKESEDNET